ncbi:hypothetical protein [Luteolibacter luteus]|uniref:HEAT repeat domain-containing protein n=1 Tax=Luteolibacter luteus TaxID=2728835 RepID=A0A858RG55_9BACT|nr:hypothetical protein [Luteolibacter luteus]QJE95544.1 hypothetical protein HHL09_07015 [Luteolibacter luteus]
MKIRVILSGLLLSASIHGEGEPPPLIRHTWAGALSPFTSTETSISTKGEVEVRITPRRGAVYSYRTSLSLPELEQLDSQLDLSGFLAETPPPVGTAGLPEIPDLGMNTLEITRAEKKRMLKFQREESLEPLVQTLRLLVGQAVAVNEIETDGNIYSAISRLGKDPAQVLQPGRLKKPLTKYIGRTADRQHLEWALTGLAATSTPEEFAAVVATGLKDEKRGDLMSNAIPSAPKEHEAALCPVLLDFLETHDTLPKLSKEKKYALEAFPRRLGAQGYKPAIPFLIARLERSGQGKPPSGSVAELAEMGAEGVRAVIPFLNRDDGQQRCRAVEILAITAALAPGKHPAQSYDEAEYAEIRPLLRKILPQLTTMAGSDPDQAVKYTVARELHRIQEAIEP